MSNIDGVATERVQYFDIAKGIGMLSVIVGHMELTSVNAFVFTYHMPLFFLISGWFFKDAPGKMKKNMRHLLLPYVITVLVMGFVGGLKEFIKECVKRNGGDPLQIFWDTLLSGLYGSGSRTDTLFGFDIPAIGAIWFLLALFWGFILLKKIIKFSKIYIRTALAFICFAFGALTAKYVWLPSSIQSAFCAVLFLYVGWELKKKWNGIFATGNRWSILGCLMVWFVALTASFTNTNMSIVRCAFPNGVLDVLGAIAASWLIVRLCIEIEKVTAFKKPLSFFGENSLIVLCVHLVELSFIPWSIIYRIIPYRAVAVILMYSCKILFNAIAVVAIKKVSLFTHLIIRKY